MRPRSGLGWLRYGALDPPTCPIQGNSGLHQSGSDQSDAPSATIVQGIRSTKIRSFAPLPEDVSLEHLVPEDHFYRRLEARLDLSFVRELVGPLYAGGGRPSVDPVVFFKKLSRECLLSRSSS
jgi:hypothetical protein